MKQYFTGCRAVTLVCLIIFITMCLSCGRVRTAIRYSRAKMGADINVKVEIAKTANQNFPVAVDMVIVSDKSLLTQLKNMTATEWFEKRDQFQRDYAGGTTLSVKSWEWVPGQLVPTIELPWKYDAVGAIIYAGYFSPGAHRVNVDPFKDIVIRLAENSFSAEMFDK